MWSLFLSRVAVPLGPDAMHNMYIPFKLLTLKIYESHCTISLSYSGYRRTSKVRQIDKLLTSLEHLVNAMCYRLASVGF